MIATRSGWITDPAAVLDAVHGAVRDALKLPDWDRTVRLLEHPPSHFAVPPGKGERYALIEITLFAGRSLAAKRALYQGLAAALGALGVPAGDLKTVLIEVPASEVDLGFEVEV
jgi:hypothetical protein